MDRKFKQSSLPSDANEARQRRQMKVASVRKEEREKSFSKRRHTEGENTLDLPSQSELLALKEEVLSGDPAREYNGTHRIRKILSKSKTPPIEIIVKLALVSKFVDFLNRDENQSLQFEACWSLTNIASGTTEHTALVVNENAVPGLVRLLHSPHTNVCEQAVWCLGNIAGDNCQYRDLVLQHDILTPLINLIRHSTQMSMIRNSTWTLSNLCRGKNPPVHQEVVDQALTVLPILLFVRDPEVLVDACWALSYLTDTPQIDQIRRVVEAKIVLRLTELLLHDNINIVTPALRCLGNIVTGPDDLTQSVLNYNIMHMLVTLIRRDNENIKKEVCWTVSNIAAGEVAQIQVIIESGIFAPIVECIRVGEFKVKKEAAWAVCNACAGGTIDQIQYLASLDSIGPLTLLLFQHKVNDVKLVLIILEALDRMLSVSRNTPDETKRYNDFESNSGLELLTNLQQSEDHNVYEKAYSITISHYPSEEADSAAPGPTINASGNYSLDFDPNAQHGNLRF